MDGEVHIHLGSHRARTKSLKSSSQLDDWL